jgi:Protein of unknown function (DUF4240)
MEAAKAETAPELSNEPEILQAKLQALPAEDITAFDLFTTLFFNAYRWDVWAAAYIIEGAVTTASWISTLG